MRAVAFFLGMVSSEKDGQTLCRTVDEIWRQNPTNCFEIRVRHAGLTAKRALSGQF